MKVLITGSNGQLGRSLLKSKPKSIEVIATNSTNFNLLKINECKEFLIESKPDWIINAGAYTAVDLAESEPNKAMSINGVAPTELAKTIKKIGGKILQISTDFVFDGNSKSPYKPIDEPNPINIYGKTKLCGERGIQEVLNNTNQYLIIRTSWVMGPIGRNFAITMLNLHKSKDNISVVSDQIGCMTSTLSLSKICWLIIEKNNLQYEKESGILHWSESGVSSWFDIATEIGDLALSIKLLEKTAKVIPISSEEYITKAKRPKFSLLDSTSTKELLNIENKYWRYSLLEILKEIKLRNILI
tara:strand:- start:3967 stop:4869 length:903 start_codon:yes stop_codon:yes gene_type:complete